MPVATLVPNYHERRLSAQERMKECGWGAQARSAFAIRLAPSIISSILNGTYENVEHLTMIEEWLTTPSDR